MNQKAWIDIVSPRFSYLQPIQHIGVVASGTKPAISPTYRHFWTPEKPAILNLYHNSKG